MPVADWRGVGASQSGDHFGSGAHWPPYRFVRCVGRGVLLEGRSIWRSRGSGHFRSASPACSPAGVHRTTPTSPYAKDGCCRLPHTRYPVVWNRHRRSQCSPADAWRRHRWRLLGNFLRHPPISNRRHFEIDLSTEARWSPSARNYIGGVRDSLSSLRGCRFWLLADGAQWRFRLSCSLQVPLGRRGGGARPGYGEGTCHDCRLIPVVPRMIRYQKSPLHVPNSLHRIDCHHLICDRPW